VPIKVTFVGHATVLIEHGGVRLLTDPVLRSRVGHLRRHGPLPQVPPAIDAVLLSHLHYDHLDVPSLRKLGGSVRLLGPRGCGRFLARAGFGAVEEMSPGETTALGALTVLATTAVHDARRRPLGPRAQALGYVIKGESSVYFAGDTDLFAGMADLGPVDLALLPVAGWSRKLGPGHLDPERAARAAALLRPRVAVPIHWGTLRSMRLGPWFSDPPHRFAAQVARLAPEVEVRVLSPGNSLEL
jgi:L-ascorbate metabolism protein UlaG (beta-lactamase superfamily)